MEPGKLNCPNCGSENTSSIPLVYKSGHGTGTAVHREVVGYDVKVETTQHFDGHIETKEVGNRPIYENVSHTTHTMTDLAREVAPPSEPKLKEMPNSLVSVGCGAIGCLMPITLTIIYFVAKYQFNKDIWAWMDYLMYAFIACTVFYLIKAYPGMKKANEAVQSENDAEMARYRNRLEAWSRSYICNRCGHKFVVED